MGIADVSLLMSSGYNQCMGSFDRIQHESGLNRRRVARHRAQKLWCELQADGGWESIAELRAFIKSLHVPKWEIPSHLWKYLGLGHPTSEPEDELRLPSFKALHTLEEHLD